MSVEFDPKEYPNKCFNDKCGSPSYNSFGGAQGKRSFCTDPECESFDSERLGPKLSEEQVQEVCDAAPKEIDSFDWAAIDAEIREGMNEILSGKRPGDEALTPEHEALLERAKKKVESDPKLREFADKSFGRWGGTLPTGGSANASFWRCRTAQKSRSAATVITTAPPTCNHVPTSTVNSALATITYVAKMIKWCLCLTYLSAL